MSSFHLHALAAALLFAIGLQALIAHVHLLRKLIALNVMSVAVFLLLLAIARRDSLDGSPDPVPQAMVLTGIVVAVSVTAFALALAHRIQARTGEARLPARKRRR